MQHIEEAFWKQLQILQEEIVGRYACQLESGVPADLYGITFDTICSMLELIDGYKGSNCSGISLVDKESRQVINQDRFLHDRCGQYLRA